MGSSGARASSYLIVLYLVQPSLHQQKHQKEGSEKAQGLCEEGKSVPSSRSVLRLVPSHSLIVWPPPSSACKQAPGQALEAVPTHGFMVSSGRLGGRCGWERVAPGGSSRCIVQPAVLGQHVPSLPEQDGCHRAGSISQTCSLTHP